MPLALSALYTRAVPEQHVILSTHTTQHLRRCLMGFAYQSRRPDSVTLSCDVESEEILELVRSCAGEFDLPVMVVQRAHTGQARCSQVRNNGVRALRAHREIAGDARLIFMDGDTAPGRRTVEMHERYGGVKDSVSTYRVNLTREQAAAFDDEAVRENREPIALLPEQVEELRARQRRYERQVRWKPVSLVKEHKPRLIGGHFSVACAAYLEVNGCDERYEGYGQEDDDLSRRLFRAGHKPVIAIEEIVVYHLWHPTRAPRAWSEAPGVARFHTRTPTRCERGVEHPMEQGPIRIIECGFNASRKPGRGGMSAARTAQATHAAI